jgi:hypothetical protein
MEKRLVDNPSDEMPFEPEVGKDSQNGLMIATPEGAYIYMADLQKFCTDNRADMVSIEPDGDVYVLRRGPDKKTYQWMSIVKDEA